jgi:succinoglycan biosynthesis transport protein ExoP
MIEEKPSPEDASRLREGVLNQYASRSRTLSTDVLSGTAPSSGASADSVLATAWRNRWVLVICVFAALVAGVVYFLAATPQYTSTAKLYLDYAGPRVPDIYAPGAVPQTDKYLNTQAGIIRSEPILSSAVDSLMSRGLRTFSGVDIPSAYLKKKMLVDVGKKDEIISVSFRSPYPLEAVEIVNCVVDTYVASHSEHEQKSSVQVLKILQDEMTQATRDLEAKRNALTTFQASHGSPSELDQSDRGVVQSACIQAKLRLLEAETFLRGVRALSQDPVALRHYVQGNESAGALPGTDQERTFLETRVAGLDLERGTSSEMLASAHPKITGMTTEMKQARAKLAELDDRFVKAATRVAEQEYADAKNRLDGIAPLLNEHEKQMQEWSANATQFEWLKSDVDTLTAHRQTLDEKIRQIQTIVGEDVSQLRMAVLEPATAAEVPSSPRKGTVVQLALLLGLLLGGGVVTVRERLNQSLHSMEEISSLLRLPILGAIPAISGHPKIQERGQRVHLLPSSVEAEAFRTVRTALFFGTRESSMKTLLITSPCPGDGKSTLVSNLAIAMADAGQKTLIVDADLRRPVQHTIFQLDHQEQCLGRVLDGKMRLGAAIQQTGVKRLHLLTFGDEVSHPAELLSSRRFASVLQHLAGAYDRILIDTPPVGVVTDAQIISILCDAAVLVVRVDKCAARAAQRAVEALRGVGAQPVGVVVNGIDRSGQRYGYHYGKYHRHGSSDSNNGGGRRPKEMAAMEASPRKLTR